MNEPIPMDDDGGATAHEMQLLHQQWLDELARDEAARREYEMWSASLLSTRNEQDRTRT